MIEHILGNYFVRKNLLSQDQLDLILKRQSEAKVRLGTIAVSEGMMTEEEAETVNMLQQSIDKHFGDIAVDLGYLTNVQVKALLSEQQNSFILFMQTIGDEKLMDASGFKRAIKQYQKDYGVTTARLEAMKSDDISAIVMTCLLGHSIHFERHASIGVRLMTRLVDKDICIGDAYTTDGSEKLCAGMYQHIIGTRSYFTGFSNCDGGLREIAKGFARDQYEEDEMFINDAAGEFLNCINGLFITTASREGENFDAEPQCYADADELSGVTGRRTLHIPIYCKKSGVEFIFSE